MQVRLNSYSSLLGSRNYESHLAVDFLNSICGAAGAAEQLLQPAGEQEDDGTVRQA
jgi:hypothetical protein